MTELTGAQTPRTPTREQLLTSLSDHNALQPIATLPPETLSTIFLFTCPPSQYTAICEPKLPSFLLGGTSQLHKISTVFQLCSVSSQWRQVAISTPSLWRKLRIHSNGRQSNNIINLIGIHATRSSSSLDLRLSLTGFHEHKPSNNYLDTYPPEDPLFFLNQLEREIFIENAEKIQKFTVELCPIPWLNLFSKLRRLTHISICFCPCKWVLDYGIFEGLSIDLSDLPLLYSVLLDAQTECRPYLTLPTNQIREFILRSGCISIRKLVECPNLIDLHYTANFPLFLFIFEPITFEKVERLTWDEPNSFRHGNFHTPFKLVRFPSLRYLQLKVHISTQDDCNELLCSITLLSPTLKELDIHLGCLGRNSGRPFFDDLHAVMPLQLESFKCIFRIMEFGP